MEQLIEFLREYILFFQKMEKKQEEKVAVLAGGDLAGVEETILEQQAMDKQLANMEAKRINVFKESGFDGMTFKQVIKQDDGTYRKELSEMYDDLDRCISNIKYLNQKAMKIAESALVRAGIKPSDVLGGNANGYGNAGGYGGAILKKSI